MEEDEVRLFSVAPCDRMRSNGQNLKYKKFHLDITKQKQHFFNCKGDWILQQAAHRINGASILGDNQNQSGHSPK